MTAKEQNRELIEALHRSELYQQYETAYGEATGMPLSLRPLEYWQLAQEGHCRENDFCKMIGSENRSCAECLSAQQTACDKAAEATFTMCCPMGLSETVVPVKVGDRVIGFLQTGQVRVQAEDAPGFAPAFKKMKELGLKVAENEAREKFEATPTWPGTRYDSVMSMLSLFAQHLGLLANKIVLQSETTDHPIIARAKQYIDENYTEDICLEDVAGHAHVSMFYLCKLFKSTTGITFSEYLCRKRIEQAKEKLMDLHTRISEVAYQVGFQSLTHFNRVFKRIVGHSPTVFRNSVTVA
jgi:AraC-like DNA-binding protein